MSRILGVGMINYVNNKIGKYSMIIERNSTTNQISLEEDQSFLQLSNGAMLEDLVMVFRYDPNLKHNLDEIHMGPQQTIFYPHVKGGFPVSYFLPLRNISTDITVNMKLKHIIYEDTDNQVDQFLDYEISAVLVDTEKLHEQVKNNNILGFPDILGVYHGQYDNTLKTGRVTIPSWKDDKRVTAVISMKAGIQNTKKEKSFTTVVLAFPENSMHYNITLPQKAYYYSNLDTNKTFAGETSKVRSGHVYKLQRESFNEKFMVIELASCDAEVHYALNDVDPLQEAFIDKNPSLLLNGTKHSHASYDHFGKRIIEVDLTNGNKDLVISIFPKKVYLQSICEEQCIVDYNIGYSIRYRSFISRDQFEKYNLKDKGIVSTQTFEDRDVILNLGTVSSQNIFKATNARYYVRLFYPSLYDHRMAMFDSICFARKTAKVYLFYYHPMPDFPFRLSSFPQNVNFVVSVLAETLDEGDNQSSLLVYTPTTVIIRSESASSWLIGNIF